MQLKQIQTKLETAPIDEISAILDAKASQVGANQTADYIGQSIENINDVIARIDNAIKEYQAVKKQLKFQEEVIKIGAAKWLNENGVKKLLGDRLSSVSVLEKTESVEVVITDEESVINAGYFKMVVDKTELKKALNEGAEVEGAYLEKIYNEDSVKINKRRKD